MKRRLTAAALALIFPLSMAACGSQSTADACKEIATARTSVHQYSAEHSIPCRRQPWTGTRRQPC